MSNIPSKITRKKTKKRTTQNTISAIFQDGVFKPLSKVDFQEGEELTLILVDEERSIAEQMYGICAAPNGIDIDATIDDEDWL